jgi:putative ATP-binding cassette transporter
MTLLDLLHRADRRELVIIAALCAVAGVANALLLVIIVAIAGFVAEGRHPGVTEGLFFVGVFAVCFQCDRLAVLRANVVIEKLLAQLRLDIADRLRRSELLAVDKVGRGALYAIVTQETNHLSITCPMMVECFQQTLLLVFSLVYLAWLSPASLVVFLVAVAALLSGSFRINKQYGRALADAASRQSALLDALRDLMQGAKELRLNSRRSERALAVFADISAQTRECLVEAGDQFAAMVVHGVLIVYAMLGAAVFLVPHFAGLDSVLIYKLIPILLFCMNPLNRVTAQAPMFVQAHVGLAAIGAIEDALVVPHPISPEEALAAAPRFRDFREIHYAGLRFTYRDKVGEPVFSTGPLDLRLRCGETLFIVGGNGGGKSTTLRLMTGLYPPEAGVIKVDGTALDHDGLAGFRELFAAIFVDFHLFDQLYGVEEANAARARVLIAEMGLAGKVDFRDGRFTELRLSTGQRKRLALIAALLEDRAIYVFDEWAAEQDVHFREYFYTRVLPQMKARGKTIVAVSHDERFWHVADRVVRIDLGALLWETPGADFDPEERDRNG